MLALLKKNRALKQTARLLYGSIVTTARRRIIYADWGMPDTLQGRFEVIVLHLVLAQHRLAAEGGGGARLARALSEAFVTDMDDCMREMTFGDLAVPREIKGVAAALFDRWKAYGALLSGEQGALGTALGDRLAYLGSPDLDVPRLADYMCRTYQAIAAQPGADILAGRVAWPTPLKTPPSQEPPP